MKICTKCNKEKELLEFPSNKVYKDGVYCWCRTCVNDYAGSYVNPNIVIPDTQVCSICKLEKDAINYSKCRTRKSGLDARCKDCYRDLTRARRGGRKKQTIEREALKSEDKFRCGLCDAVLELKLKTTDGCCESCKKERGQRYRLTHYTYTTESRREQSKKYADRERLDRHKRRARKANAAGFFTKEQLQARFRYFGYKCIYCDSTDRISVEHLIPLSRGGTNWASNIAPSCLKCNCSKNKRTHKEFIEYRKYSSEVISG